MVSYENIKQNERINKNLEKNCICIYKKRIATNFFHLKERVVTLSSKGVYQVFPCNF